MKELPFETYERVFCEPWPGGRSNKIKMFLSRYGIPYRAGTAAANLELQRYWLWEIR